MPVRPCLDCSTPTTGRRCTRCAQTEAATRSRTYGTPHRHAKTELATTLPAPCGYGCGTTLHPDDDWVAAHLVDRDPTAGWIVSCRSCNELAKQPR